MALQSTINHPLEFILRLFGIWPSSRYRVLKSIVWTLLLLTFLVFQYWYFISHLKSTDLTDLLDGLSLTLSNNLVLLKLIVIWFHNRTFCDILTSMLEDWNCPSLGEKKQIMIHKANLSSRITNVLFTYYFVSFVLYAGITVALLREDNDGTQTRKFFIKMVFPFDVTTSLLYSLILVLQFVLECILAFAAAMFMALIATLILHVGSQVEIFCQTLTEVPIYSGKDESRVLIFKDLVSRHQRIITLSENIQNMFKYISLGQFLSNMMVIGFVSFLFAVVSKLFEHGARICSNNEVLSLLRRCKLRSIHSLLHWAISF
ncbi:uncharacterized protein LOC128882397 isoform X4 [Hylaeus volcanicus]|uniref:uncharacterized protein LOC128882397 isoform X4 n=1 Tax=Hylaeus volcanicus TaxID=313075 RepID=UPI0023B85965|nr:uncharacterized protein LOC128882397 isoform X4 [Hylaeus volcanicus]